MISTPATGSTLVSEDWDDDQKLVIGEDAHSRLLVIAGPGTGKTAVACARIAHLINEGTVEPVNVLLVSFTRTAVAELRNRIGSYIGNPAKAAGVRIATIDSTTWTLLNGFDADAASAFGGYDANIERLCDQLKQRNEDLLEHLSKYEHIVVDEAQDVLGSRAQLIDLIIDHTSPACGITVLADPCQAIYGFTTENGETIGSGNYSLVDRLQSARPTRRFETFELQILHRTSEPSLVHLLKVMRPTITAKSEGRDKYRVLRAQIEYTAPELGNTRETLVSAAAGRDDLLVLYRTRAEALLTASMFCSSQASHRLRISGLPAWLLPWIGAVFSDYTQPQIEQAAFDRRWNDRGCADLLGSPTADEAWQHCLRLAGHGGRVKLDLLRRALARSRPPVEFCVVDNGTSGPTIGTIHASKGREANSVFLYLPQEPDGDELAWDEEASVLYVGATRARHSIQVATGGPTYSRILGSTGRPYRRRANENAAQFEVGREGDLDVGTIVSPTIHSTQEALSQQDTLRASSGSIMKLVADSQESWGWRYRLRRSEGGADHAIGEMTKAFSEDVYAIARSINCNSPRTIPNIWQVGVRTVVLPIDSPHVARLISPFDRTGIFLVPVLRAWTKSFFGRR